MKTYHTKAVVIKKIRLSEGDTIVTLFTEQYGKVSVMARGLCFFKNRYHGKLEPPACIYLNYTGKGARNLPFFNSCETVDPFKNIGEDLGKIFTAFYLLELVDSWIKESDPNQPLFHLLHASLSLLEKMETYDTLIRVFELRLLSLTGYAPKLDGCLKCGKLPEQATLYFNFEKGGIICSQCAGGRPMGQKISLGSLNFAQKGSGIHYPHIHRLKIPKGLAKEIEMLSHHFLISRLGKELKSYRFLGLD